MSTLFAPNKITGIIQTPVSNPNPNMISTYVNDNLENRDDLGFEFLDYLAFGDQVEEDYNCNFTSLLLESPGMVQDNHTSTESSMNSNHDEYLDNTHVLQMYVSQYIFTNHCV